MKPSEFITVIMIAAVAFAGVCALSISMQPPEVPIIGESGLPADDDPLWEMPVEGPRSACWGPTRNAWLSEHPRCEFKGCKSKGPFEAHHIVPFHDNPKRECDSANLITLCRGEPNHHLFCGHQGSFREHNRNVAADCRRGTYPRIGWERKQRHDQKRPTLKGW